MHEDRLLVEVESWTYTRSLDAAERTAVQTAGQQTRAGHSSMAVSSLLVIYSCLWTSGRRENGIWTKHYLWPGNQNVVFKSSYLILFSPSSPSSPSSSYRSRTPRIPWTRRLQRFCRRTGGSLSRMSIALCGAAMWVPPTLRGVLNNSTSNHPLTPPPHSSLPP